MSSGTHPERKPFRVIRKHAGAVDVEFDTWEGPSEVGGVGGWRTHRRNGVTRQNVRQFFAPSVSFLDQLMKAL